MQKTNGVRYYEYNSVSWKDKLRKNGRQAISIAPADNTSASAAQAAPKKSAKAILRSAVKKTFYILFPNDPVYPLHRQWIKEASRFKSTEPYDLIVSNSSPAASHRLVMDLLKKGSVKAKKWIQIWEDPWYYDLYGGHTEAEKKEETELLKAADTIYYVSPLTLMYQKRYFPECADKMRFVPLPAYRFTDTPSPEHEEPVLGYFGDYYSHVRNLEPFLNAVQKDGFSAYVIGDTDLHYNSGDKLFVHPRMTLAELSQYQDNTDILVHLCNLRGGQIPGKVYHYSITDRQILFILDGTEEEKTEICSFFSQFNRYCFCENNEEDISAAINQLIHAPERTEEEVADFYPVNIVKKLLEENS